MPKHRLNFARTLHGRFLLAFLLTGIIPLGLVSFGIAMLQSRSINEQSAKELIGLARGLAGQLDVHLTELLEESRMLAALPDIAGMIPGRQGPLLKEISRHRATFARLATFDRSGRLLASSHPGTPSSIGMRESFKIAARSGRQAWMVDATLSTGRSSLLIHTPIRDAERHVAGVLGVVVDLEDLSAAVGRVRVGRGGKAFILDASGRVLLHEDKAAVQKRPDYSWTGVPTGGWPAGSGTVRYSSRGESFVAGYALVPNTGWTVVVERPEAEILMPARRSFRLALAGLGLSAVLAMTVALLSALKLTRPVRELTQAAQVLAAGNSPVRPPVNLTREGELGVLAEAFESMRDAVEGREKALKNRARQQAAVAQLGQHAVAGAEISALMNEVVAVVAETLSLEYCKVLELLPDGKALLLRAGVGWKEGYVGCATVPAGTDSQAGYTLLSNEPVIVEDLRTEKRFSGPPLLHDHGVISGMSAIIRGKERPFGVIGAHTTRRRAFTHDDAHFLQAVANILASAIERGRTEQELRKLSSVVEQTADLVYITDPRGIIEYVNPAFEKLVGYSKEEVIGKTPRILKSGQHEEAFYRDLWQTILSGRSFRGVIANRKKDGEIFYEEKTITPLKDAQDRITHFVSTGKDITGSRKAQEEIQRSLERMRALHEINVAVTSTLDLRHVLRLLLDKVDLFLPYPAATVRLLNRESGLLESVASRNLDEEEWKVEARKGRGLADLVFETRTALMSSNVQTDPRTGNREFFRRHGLVSYLGVPLIAKNEVVGVLNFYTQKEHRFSDEEVEHLTALAQQAAVAIQNAQLYEEMRLRETRLQEANRTLSALYSVMAAASQSLDLDRILGAAMEKITAIFGFEITSIHIYDEETDELLLRASIENDPDRLTLARSFKRGQGIHGKVLESGKPLIFDDIRTDPLYRQLAKTKIAAELGLSFYAVFPIRGKLKNLGTLACGSLAPRKLSSQEVQLLEALLAQVAVAIENSQLHEDVKQKVRELQEKTGELERASKVKDEFLNVMSHELRTPLNVIMGYAGLIQDGLLGEISEKQQEALRRILRSATDLLSMVTTILQATALEARSVETHWQEVNLPEVFEQIKTADDLPLEKEVELVWDCPSNIPPIKTDGEKLTIILHNLIGNATKFTEKGQVKVSARYFPETKTVQFKVADTGIGIPEDMIPVIFEKFRQVDSSETRRYGGIGLGLYIVRGFAELLGGKVEVESEVGKGSVFTVTIPAKISSPRQKETSAMQTGAESENPV